MNHDKAKRCRLHRELIKLARSLPSDGIVRTKQDYSMVHLPMGQRVEQVLVLVGPGRDAIRSRCVNGKWQAIDWVTFV